MNQEIFTGHPLYRGHGVPDTPLDDDGVVGAEPDKARYLFDYRRMDDGVLFASKTLVIRKSPTDAVCEAQGRRPGGPAGDRRSPPGTPPDGTRPTPPTG